MSKYTVDDEMARVVGSLESIEPHTVQYKDTVNNLKTLAEVKNAKKGGFSISGDTIFNGVIMVVSTLVVLYFEKEDVVRSKAFGWIGKKL